MNKINCSLLPLGVFRKKKADCSDSEDCIGCTPLAINGRVVQYVLRVPDRREAIHFFRNVLGMKVLRHEEFSTGCGPACKGFCGTLWSKTMVGYGPENKFFAFELAYSYTNEKYEGGNAICSITIKGCECLKQATKNNWPVGTGNVLTAPGGYKFNILDGNMSKNVDPVQKITLASSNIKKTIKYWNGALGVSLSSVDHKKKTCGFCFKENTVEIEFQEVEQEINHADSFGRLSFTCPVAQLSKIERTIVCTKHTIISPLTTVKANGRDIYRVIVLADPDEHEVCFYDETSYKKLSKFNPEASTILDRYVELENGSPTDKESMKSSSSQIKKTDTSSRPAKKENDSISAATPKEVASDTAQVKKDDIGMPEGQHEDVEKPSIRKPPDSIEAPGDKEQYPVDDKDKSSVRSKVSDKEKPSSAESPNVQQSYPVEDKDKSSVRSKVSDKEKPSYAESPDVQQSYPVEDKDKSSVRSKVSDKKKPSFAESPDVQQSYPVEDKDKSSVRSKVSDKEKPDSSVSPDVQQPNSVEDKIVDKSSIDKSQLITSGDKAYSYTPRRNSSGLLQLYNKQQSAQMVQNSNNPFSATNWEYTEPLQVKESATEANAPEQKTSITMKRADSEKVVVTPQRSISKQGVTEWKQTSLGISDMAQVRSDDSQSKLSGGKIKSVARKRSESISKIRFSDSKTKKGKKG